MRKICIPCGSRFGSDALFCPHDGSRLELEQDPHDPLLGTMLLQQFRIDEVVGSGGMGTVYRARQVTVGRDVAVKVLRAELAQDEEAVARFEREARVATALDHPNVVRVLLSGRLDDGRVYIIMELLEGRSLSDELDAEGSLTVHRTLTILMKLCAGLSAVHAAGVIHRDIKPENIFLVRRGADPDFVKVVDFGIARAIEGDTLGTAGQAGRVFGTAAYISPEAATGDEVDDRSDIYSLGVLAYQMLTGELPFNSETPSAMLMQHVHDPAPHIQTRKGGGHVPPEVAEVVMRSLSKEPAQRPQTLAELVEALAEAGAQAGLFEDAPGLLFGTVWGHELTQQHSYLAELLGGRPPSRPPSSSRPVPPQDNDLLSLSAEDEALLSEAPSPFESRPSYPGMSALGARRQGVLWTGLIVLVVGLLAFVAKNAFLTNRVSLAEGPGHVEEVLALEPTEPSQTSAPSEPLASATKYVRAMPSDLEKNAAAPLRAATAQEPVASASKSLEPARAKPASAPAPAPKKTAAPKPEAKPKKEAVAPKQPKVSPAEQPVTPRAGVPAEPAEQPAPAEVEYPAELMNPWPAALEDAEADAPAEPASEDDRPVQPAHESPVDESPVVDARADSEDPVADPVADPADDDIDWTAPPSPDKRRQERPANPVVIDEPPSESDSTSATGVDSDDAVTGSRNEEPVRGAAEEPGEQGSEAVGEPGDGESKTDEERMEDGPASGEEPAPVESSTAVEEPGVDEESAASDEPAAVAPAETP